MDEVTLFPLMCVCEKEGGRIFRSHYIDVTCSFIINPLTV